MPTGRCLKCRQNDIEMNEPEYGVNARGLNFVRGKCPKCGTTMYRILPKDFVVPEGAAKAEAPAPKPAEKKAA